VSGQSTTVPWIVYLQAAQGAILRLRGAPVGNPASVTSATLLNVVLSRAKREDATAVRRALAGANPDDTAFVVAVLACAKTRARVLVACRRAPAELARLDAAMEGALKLKAALSVVPGVSEALAAARRRVRQANRDIERSAASRGRVGWDGAYVDWVRLFRCCGLSRNAARIIVNRVPPAA
jgi:hypothetical protein